MNISVILCTRNRLPDVLSFLESLYGQTRLPEELIVVDSSDVPMDEQSEFVNAIKAHKGIKYIHSRPGLTLQRNVGIEHCNGELFFFFDDDVVLNRNFLEIMVDTFETHPEYMGGMGTINGVKINKLSFYYILKRIFLLQTDGGNGKFLLSGMPRHPYGTNEFKEVEVLGGGLSAYRRELFTKHGFKFDEALSGYASQEDVDFSRRVSRKWKLFFNPGARLDHNKTPAEMDRVYDNRKMYMVNFRYFYLKNFYPYAKWTLLFHWWAVLGLFVLGFTAEANGTAKGYWAGLLEFYRRKKKML